ncbi:LysR family transcriptional regulator [Sulfitobacter porphyrae]|uniref:LysR family transcriptional regulator n=1 Tax=Sulfitobacter porphyrae TaxID=1246864 RepID=A0ABW2AYW3_9RHOB|nr:transcriptional regulator [Sulfitobacter porphyrae]
MNDLGLLRILVAVHECGSTTGAAERLNVSQPSISQGLGRLRDITGDQMFIRGSRSMTPTSLATQLYLECRSPLNQLEGTFRADEPFDPKTTRDRFTIAFSDIGALTFLPPLVGALQKRAPGIRIEATPLEITQVDSLLKSGRLDFAIGKLETQDPALSQIDLIDQHYAAIVRRDHPTIQGALDEETFRNAAHAVVSDAAGHWQAVSHVVHADEPAFDVRLTLAQFNVLPATIRESNLIGVVPHRSAVAFSETWNLQVLDIPIPLPRFTVRLLAHKGTGQRRTAYDWMTTFIKDVLGSGPTDPGQV